MWRHAEGDDLALLTEILEGKRLVALVAVNNEQHMATYPPLLYLLNKVLQPGQTNLVGSPAVVANPNAPIRLQGRVPGCVVVLCFKDKVGRNCPAYCVDCSN